jgi:hypothetical protein
MSENDIDAALNKLETSEPGIDYTPMPVAEPEEPRKKTYGNDIDSLRDAAKDLDKSREERGITQDEPTDRSWRWLQGEREGQPVDPKYTLTESQAADSLIAARAADVNAKYPAPDEIAAKIDAARQEYAQGQQPPVEQPPAQTAEQQPVEQPQPEQIDGVHPDVVAALQNENVRNAIAAEVAQTEQARQAYQQASLQAAQLSAAALFAFEPSLANMSAQELPGALKLIAQQNPERAAALNAHIQRTSNLYQASQEAAKQQQAVQQQRDAAWQKSQDDAYDAATKDSPEIRSKLGKEAIAMLKEYGASDDEIKAAWNSAGPFRSAVGQRILRDAAAYRISQREIANKLDRSVPPVQRPGTSAPRGDDEGVAQALARFNLNPTPQNGAALLGARRAARR